MLDKGCPRGEAEKKAPQSEAKPEEHGNIDATTKANGRATTLDRTELVKKAVTGASGKIDRSVSSFQFRDPLPVG
jgi:hypothetical protein